MKRIVVALVQVDFTVGALRPNAEKIARLAGRLHAEGAGVVVFPELALCGYPPEDLVLKPHFLDDAAAALGDLAAALPPAAVVLAGAPVRRRGRVLNAAAVLAGGRLAAVYGKHLLPNYGVFDEKRLFAPGGTSLVLTAPGARLGVHVCEDSWESRGAPCRRLAAAGVDAVLNLSASPYHRGKAAERLDVLAAAARAVGAPLLYCNLVGGQDELVFDGASMAVGADGRLRARAAAFEEDVLWFELPCAARSGAKRLARLREAALPVPIPPARRPRRPRRIAPLPGAVEEVYRALSLGLRDYMDKNGFGKAVIALSGGIDSALVAVLAADALGADRVHAVTMPSRYSSAGTRRDARRLARNLGIPLRTIPIDPLVEACRAALAPHWGAPPPDLVEENVQARLRGLLVMALSNAFGWLVLSTGNKSELAMGYCTLYGDMAGGYALIKDVPKTLVFELCRWRNAQGRPPVIPPSVLTRAPSAELRENQRDEDSLPPYARLDPILERYVERDGRFDAIVAEGFAPETVARVIRGVDAAEYKRRQGAPGVRITARAFGRDRRMPIVNLYREGPRPAGVRARGTSA